MPKLMKIILIIVAVLAVAFIVVQIFASRSQRNIETYPFQVKKKYKNFEVRSYEETLFTSVKLPMSDYKQASGKGFSLLAGYIFGGNKSNEKIAMTSPVSMSLEDSMTMMFMVPKKYNKETLPQPNQSQIAFEEVPAKTMAAITFGGWADDEKIEKHKVELIAALEAEGLTHNGKFYFFGYNAPYEVFNRKNEVLVELGEGALD
jgi:hypothetical protein